MSGSSAKLSAMMFIQFFVWGSWYVTVGNYMGEVGIAGEMVFGNIAVAQVYSVGPIAAIISPFFLGLVADRFFATQKVLGWLHLLGGILMFIAPMAANAGAADLFVLILLLHMLCYMPTLGLTNTLAFHNIKNQEKEFPVIRVFGTIGWIVAGLIVSTWLGADKTALPLQVAAVAGILMGIYSFFLPDTPPPAAGSKPTVREILGIDAISQLSSTPFWVFIVSSFLICIPLAAYYAFAPIFIDSAGVENVAGKMLFGQISEVVFMLLVPILFARFGVKWMLLVGMLAWVVRYGLFAIAAPHGVFWMIMAGVVLHGICYDFFFVAGQIYVDKKSNESIRGQAQGFLVLMTYGAGMLIGSQVSGWLNGNIITGDGATAMLQWQEFWIWPAGFALVIMLIFGALFKDTVK